MAKVVETISNKDFSVEVKETGAVPRQFFGLIGGDSHRADFTTSDGTRGTVYGNSAAEVRSEAVAAARDSKK